MDKNIFKKPVAHRLPGLKGRKHDNVIEVDSLSSRIADVTYNYKEFQEPLVEFDE